MQSVCFVLFVYCCDLAIRESAQLGSSGAARTLATVSVTVTTLTNAILTISSDTFKHEQPCVNLWCYHVEHWFVPIASSIG